LISNGPTTQTSTDLTNWTNIGNSIVGLGGATNQLFSADVVKKFYRITLQ